MFCPWWNRHCLGLSIVMGDDQKWLLYDLYNGKSSENGWSDWSVPPWLPIWNLQYHHMKNHGVSAWLNHMKNHGSPCLMMKDHYPNHLLGDVWPKTQQVLRLDISVNDLKTRRENPFFSATLCIGSSSEKDEQRMFRSCYRDTAKKKMAIQNRPTCFFCWWNKLDMLQKRLKILSYAWDMMGSSPGKPTGVLVESSWILIILLWMVAKSCNSDSWNPINNGMFTIYQLVQDFATIQFSTFSWFKSKVSGHWGHWSFPTQRAKMSLGEEISPLSSRISHYNYNIAPMVGI